MSKNTTLGRQRRKGSRIKPKDSFWGGLFSLMTKQCIISALLFASLYFTKNSELPVLNGAFSFVQNIVLSPSDAFSALKIFS